MVKPFFIEALCRSFPRITLRFTDLNQQEACAKPEYYHSVSPYFKSVEYQALAKDHTHSCFRYYKVDTLDGSDFYMCKHRAKVN